MKRREFIKQSAALSSLICLSGIIPAEAAGKEASVVAVSGESPAEIARRAVAELGGMGRFVSRGDVVMIKPNIAWNRTPEQAATTHPEVVRAMVELALGAGAKKVIVMDNPCHRAADTYERSGIAAAARQAGAEVRFADENRLVVHDFKGEYVRNWQVYRDFLEVDKFINVPILKHHGSSELTIAMKNLFGILGGNRGKLHRDMGENIADLASGFPSHLVVVDAYRILTRNGPVGGRLSDVALKKTVIASANIVEADAVAAEFFGVVPGEVEFLQAAASRKMGEIDSNKIVRKSLTI